MLVRAKCARAARGGVGVSPEAAWGVEDPARGREGGGLRAPPPRCSPTHEGFGPQTIPFSPLWNRPQACPTSPPSGVTCLHNFLLIWFRNSLLCQPNSGGSHAPAYWSPAVSPICVCVRGRGSHTKGSSAVGRIDPPPPPMPPSSGTGTIPPALRMRRRTPSSRPLRRGHDGARRGGRATGICHTSCCSPTKPRRRFTGALVPLRILITVCSLG